MRLPRSDRTLATALGAVATTVAVALTVATGAAPAAPGGPATAHAAQSGPGRARGPDPAAGADSVTDSAAVDQLLRAARGADPVLCELARRTVDQQGGWWGGGGELPGVLGAGSDSQPPRVVTAAVARGARAPGVVPLLRVALGDADPCVRRLAAPLLGRVEGAPARDAMLAALRDPSPATRHAAAIALGFAGAPEARGPLVAALRTDPAPPVRAAAAWALGRTR